MDQSVRLPTTAHTAMPWRIHAITNDFRIEDVWALPTPGGAEDFPRLLALVESWDRTHASPSVRLLFAIRRGLGAALGLDRDDDGGDAHFRPMYIEAREAAFELVNRTVHGVLHLGWVDDGSGGYRGQLAVLVKPNGRFGHLYLRAIAPFRHVVVYPQLLDALGRRWRQRARQLEVPDDVRALSTLAEVDYADAFLVPTAARPDWTAERWARAVLEDAPAAQRARLVAGWTALGLKVIPGRSESILGWQLRRYQPDVVLLGADSRVGMPGELLFAVRPEGLLFATFVHFDAAVTRAVWTGVAPTHVRVVRELLDSAAATATVREAAAAG
jgi:hypothetical protein